MNIEEVKKQEMLNGRLESYKRDFQTTLIQLYEKIENLNLFNIPHSEYEEAVHHLETEFSHEMDESLYEQAMREMMDQEIKHFKETKEKLEILDYYIEDVGMYSAYYFSITTKFKRNEGKVIFENFAKEWLTIYEERDRKGLIDFTEIEGMKEEFWDMADEFISFFQSYVNAAQDIPLLLKILLDNYLSSNPNLTNCYLEKFALKVPIDFTIPLDSPHLLDKVKLSLLRPYDENVRVIENLKYAEHNVRAFMDAFLPFVERMYNEIKFVTIQKHRNIDDYTSNFNEAVLKLKEMRKENGE